MLRFHLVNCLGWGAILLVVNSNRCAQDIEEILAFMSDATNCSVLQFYHYFPTANYHKKTGFFKVKNAGFSAQIQRVTKG